MTEQATKMADDLLESIKGFVRRNLESLAYRISALEERGPQTGEKGDPGKDGHPGSDGKGEKGDTGQAGEDGRDGLPGRDAVHVDVLERIDETRRYQRGTFAHHRGGLVRAFKATEPLGDDMEKSGWHVVVNGTAEIVVDGAERGFTMRAILTDGTTATKSVTLPVMIYRGVLRDGHEYQPGDTATWGGSLWHCNEPTSEKPIDGGKSWTLAAKRGRDAK